MWRESLQILHNPRDCVHVMSLCFIGIRIWFNQNVIDSRAVSRPVMACNTFHVINQVTQVYFYAQTVSWIAFRFQRIFRTRAKKKSIFSYSIDLLDGPWRISLPIFDQTIATQFPNKRGVFLEFTGIEWKSRFRFCHSFLQPGFHYLERTQLSELTSNCPSIGAHRSRLTLLSRNTVHRTW